MNYNQPPSGGEPDGSQSGNAHKPQQPASGAVNWPQQVPQQVHPQYSNGMVGYPMHNAGAAPASDNSGQQQQQQQYTQAQQQQYLQQQQQQQQYQQQQQMNMMSGGGASASAASVKPHPLQSQVSHTQQFAGQMPPQHMHMQPQYIPTPQPGQQQIPQASNPQYIGAPAASNPASAQQQQQQQQVDTGAYVSHHFMRGLDPNEKPLYLLSNPRTPIKEIQFSEVVNMVLSLLTGLTAEFPMPAPSADPNVQAIIDRTQRVVREGVYIEALTTLLKHAQAKEWSRVTRTMIQFRENLEMLLNAAEHILSPLIPALLYVLSRCTSPQSVENEEHKLRFNILTLLVYIPSAELPRHYFSDCIRVILQVLLHDNEENAIPCIQILTNLFNSAQYNTQSISTLTLEAKQVLSVILSMLKLTDQAIVYNYARSSEKRAYAEGTKLFQFSQFPCTIEVAPEEEVFPTSLYPSSFSFKLLQELPQLALTVCSVQVQQLKEIIPHVLALLLRSLRFLPIQVMPTAPLVADMANSPYKMYSYVEFSGIHPSHYNFYENVLTTHTRTLNFVGMMVKPFRSCFRDVAAHFCNAIIMLLYVCPPQLSSLRKEILIAARYALANDITATPLLSSNAAEIVNSNILLGSSPSSTIKSNVSSFMHELVQKGKDQSVSSSNGIFQLAHLKSMVVTACGILKDHSVSLNALIGTSKIILKLVEILLKNNDIENAVSIRGLMLYALTVVCDKMQWMAEQAPQILLLHHQSVHRGNDSTYHPSVLPLFDQKNADGTPTHPQPHSTATNTPVNPDRPPIQPLLLNFSPVTAVQGILMCDINILPVELAARNNIQNTVYLLQDLSTTLLTTSKLLMWCLQTIRIMVHDVPVVSQLSSTETGVVKRLFRSALTTFSIFSATSTGICEDSYETPLSAGKIPPSQNTSLTYLQLLLNVLLTLHPVAFKDVITSSFSFLFEKIVDTRAVALLPLVQFLLQSEIQYSKPFADAILGFAITRLDYFLNPTAMSRSAAALFQIIRLVFSQLQHTTDLEFVLKPYLVPMVSCCLRYIVQKTFSYQYLSLLRSLFRSIGVGCFELLYKEFTVVIPDVLHTLHKLYRSSPLVMPDICMELFLSIPSRLNSLYPYLHLVSSALVYALQASDEVTLKLALRTLDFWLSHLDAEHVLLHVHPHLPVIVQSVCDIMRCTAPTTVGQAINILGKLGARTRSWNQSSLPLFALPSSTSRHKFDQNSSIYTNNLSSMYKYKLLMHPHTEVTMSLGHVIQIAQEYLLRAHASRLIYSQVLGIKHTVIPKHVEYKKIAYCFLRSCVAALIDVRHYSNPAAYPWHVVDVVAAKRAGDNVFTQTIDYTNDDNEHKHNGPTRIPMIKPALTGTHRVMQDGKAVSVGNSNNNVDVSLIVEALQNEESHSLVRDIAMMLETLAHSSLPGFQTSVEYYKSGPVLALLGDGKAKAAKRSSGGSSKASRRIEKQGLLNIAQFPKYVHTDIISSLPQRADPHSSLMTLENSLSDSSFQAMHITERQYRVGSTESVLKTGFEDPNVPSNARGSVYDKYSLGSGAGDTYSVQAGLTTSHPTYQAALSGMANQTVNADAEIALSQLVTSLIIAAGDADLAADAECDAANVLCGLTRHTALLYALRSHNRAVIDAFYTHSGADVLQDVLVRSKGEQPRAAKKDDQSLFKHQEDVCASLASPDVLKVAASLSDSQLHLGRSGWVAPSIVLKAIVYSIAHKNTDVAQAAELQLRYFLRSLIIFLGTKEVCKSDAVAQILALAYKCCINDNANIKYAGVLVIHCLIQQMPKRWLYKNVNSVLLSLLLVCSDDKKNISVSTTALARDLTLCVVKLAALRARERDTTATANQQSASISLSAKDPSDVDWNYVAYNLLVDKDYTSTLYDSSGVDFKNILKTMAKNNSMGDEDVITNIHPSNESSVLATSTHTHKLTLSLMVLMYPFLISHQQSVTSLAHAALHTLSRASNCPMQSIIAYIAHTVLLTTNNLKLGASSIESRIGFLNVIGFCVQNSPDSIPTSVLMHFVKENMQFCTNEIRDNSLITLKGAVFNTAYNALYTPVDDLAYLSNTHCCEDVLGSLQSHSSYSRYISAVTNDMDLYQDNMLGKNTEKVLKTKVSMFNGEEEDKSFYVKGLHGVAMVKENHWCTQPGPYLCPCLAAYLASLQMNNSALVDNILPPFNAMGFTCDLETSSALRADSSMCIYDTVAPRTIASNRNNSPEAPFEIDQNDLESLYYQMRNSSTDCTNTLISTATVALANDLKQLTEFDHSYSRILKLKILRQRVATTFTAPTKSNVSRYNETMLHVARLHTTNNNPNTLTGVLQQRQNSLLSSKVMTKEPLALGHSTLNPSMSPASAMSTIITRLRVECLKMLSLVWVALRPPEDTLSEAVSAAVPTTRAEMTNLRNEIVYCFFRCLNSRFPEVADEASRALAIVVQTEKLTKDMLQVTLRTFLSSLKEAMSINSHLIDTLRRLFQLFAQQFNSQLATYLIGHLWQYCSSADLTKLRESRLKQWNLQLEAVYQFFHLDPFVTIYDDEVAFVKETLSVLEFTPTSDQVPKTVSLTLKLDLMLPSLQQPNLIKQFVCDSYMNRFNIEQATQFAASTSPFRAAIVSFQSIYAKESLNYFMMNLNDPHISGLFVDVLAHPDSVQLRNLFTQTIAPQRVAELLGVASVEEATDSMVDCVEANISVDSESQTTTTDGVSATTAKDDKNDKPADDTTPTPTPAPAAPASTAKEMHAIAKQQLVLQILNVVSYYIPGYLSTPLPCADGSTSTIIQTIMTYVQHVVSHASDYSDSGLLDARISFAVARPTQLLIYLLARASHSVPHNMGPLCSLVYLLSVVDGGLQVLIQQVCSNIVRHLSPSLVHKLFKTYYQWNPEPSSASALDRINLLRHLLVPCCIRLANSVLQASSTPVASYPAHQVTYNHNGTGIFNLPPIDSSQPQPAPPSAAHMHFFSNTTEHIAAVPCPLSFAENPVVPLPPTHPIADITHFSAANTVICNYAAKLRGGVFPALTYPGQLPSVFHEFTVPEDSGTGSAYPPQSHRKFYTNPDFNVITSGTLFAPFTVHTLLTEDIINCFFDSMLVLVAQATVDSVKGDKFNEMDELNNSALAIEALRLLICLLEARGKYITVDYQRKIIRAAWSLLKHRDLSVRSWAYVFIARFVDTTYIAAKIAQQAYSSLVREKNNDPVGRLLLARAIDGFTLALPRRLGVMEQRNPTWVRWLKILTLESQNSVDVLVAIMQNVLRMPTFYYSSRVIFVMSFVSAISRIVFASSVTIDQKKTAIDIVELILAWEVVALQDTERVQAYNNTKKAEVLEYETKKAALAETLLPTAQEYVLASLKKKYPDQELPNSSISQTDILNYAKERANDMAVAELGKGPPLLDTITTNSLLAPRTGEINPSLAQVADIVVNFLIKFVMNSFTDMSRTLTKRALGLLNTSLGLWNHVVTPRLVYVERALQTFAGKPEESTAVSYSLDLCNTVLAHCTPTSAQVHMEKISKVVNIALNIPHERIRTALVGIFNKLIVLFPPYPPNVPLPAGLAGATNQVVNSQVTVAINGTVQQPRIPTNNNVNTPPLSSLTRTAFNVMNPPNVQTFYDVLQKQIFNALQRFDRSTFSTYIMITTAIAAVHPAFLDWDHLYAFIIKTFIRCVRDHLCFTENKVYNNIAGPDGQPVGLTPDQVTMHTAILLTTFPKLLYLIFRRRSMMAAENRRTIFLHLHAILDSSQDPSIMATVLDAYSQLLGMTFPLPHGYTLLPGMDPSLLSVSPPPLTPVHISFPANTKIYAHMPNTSNLSVSAGSSQAPLIPAYSFNRMSVKEILAFVDRDHRFVMLGDNALLVQYLSLILRIAVYFDLATTPGDLLTSIRNAETQKKIVQYRDIFAITTEPVPNQTLSGSRATLPPNAIATLPPDDRNDTSNPYAYVHITPFGTAVGTKMGTKPEWLSHLLSTFIIGSICGITPIAEVFTHRLTAHVAKTPYDVLNYLILHHNWDSSNEFVSPVTLFARLALHCVDDAELTPFSPVGMSTLPPLATALTMNPAVAEKFDAIYGIRGYEKNVLVPLYSINGLNGPQPSVGSRVTGNSIVDNSVLAHYYRSRDYLNVISGSIEKLDSPENELDALVDANEVHRQVYTIPRIKHAVLSDLHLSGALSIHAKINIHPSVHSHSTSQSCVTALDVPQRFVDHTCRPLAHHTFGMHSLVMAGYLPVTHQNKITPTQALSISQANISMIHADYQGFNDILTKDKDETRTLSKTSPTCARYVHLWTEKVQENPWNNLWDAVSTQQSSSNVLHDYYRKAICSNDIISSSQLQGGLLAEHSVWVKNVHSWQSSGQLLKHLIAFVHSDLKAAYHVWVELFPHLWRALTDTQRETMSEAITVLLSRDSHRRTVGNRYSIVNLFLDGIISLMDTSDGNYVLSDDIPIPPPEVLKFVAANHGGWYRVLRILEAYKARYIVEPQQMHHTTLFQHAQSALQPNVSSNGVASVTYGQVLSELYEMLNDQDGFYGYWRTQVSIDSTKSGLCYSHHGVWQKAQEHLYYALRYYTSEVDKYVNPQTQQQNVTTNSELLCRTTAAEIQLCIDQWIRCCKFANQWDILSETSAQLAHPELQLECSWRLGNWNMIRDTVKRYDLTESPKVKLHLLLVHIHMYLQRMIPQNNGSDDDPALDIRNLPTSDALNEIKAFIDSIYQIYVQDTVNLPVRISGAHSMQLHKIHRFVEVIESFDMLSEVTAYRKDYQQAAATAAGADGKISLSNLDVAAGVQAKLTNVNKILQTWRGRGLLEHDGLNLWSDIMGWRLHVFEQLRDVLPMTAAKQYYSTQAAIMKALPTADEALDAPTTAAGLVYATCGLPVLGAGAQHGQYLQSCDESLGELRYVQTLPAQTHDISWSMLRFAQIARKHGLPGASHTVLHKLVSTSGASPFSLSKPIQIVLPPVSSETETTISIQNDLTINNPADYYFALYEQAAGLMHLDPIASLGILTQANFEYIPNKLHRSELLRLKAEILLSIGYSDEANSAFSTAVSTCETNGNAWLAWGQLCSKIAASMDSNAPEASSLSMNALLCFIESIAYHGENNCKVLPKIIHLLQQGNVDSVTKSLHVFDQEINQFIQDIFVHNKTNVSVPTLKVQPHSVHDTFAQLYDLVPQYMWVGWLPQLVQLRLRVDNKSMHTMLSRISNSYPQLTYPYVRSHLLHMREALSSQRCSKAATSDLVTEHTLYNSLETLLQTITHSNVTTLVEQERLLDDLSRRLRKSSQQDFYTSLVTVQYKAYKPILTTSRADAVPLALCSALDKVHNKFFIIDAHSLHQAQSAQVPTQAFYPTAAALTPSAANTTSNTYATLLKKIQFIQHYAPAFKRDLVPPPTARILKYKFHAHLQSVVTGLGQAERALKHAQSVVQNIQIEVEKLGVTLDELTHQLQQTQQKVEAGLQERNDLMRSCTMLADGTISTTANVYDAIMLVDENFKILDAERIHKISLVEDAVMKYDKAVGLLEEAEHTCNVCELSIHHLYAQQYCSMRTLIEVTLPTQIKSVQVQDAHGTAIDIDFLALLKEHIHNDSDENHDKFVAAKLCHQHCERGNTCRMSIASMFGDLLEQYKANNEQDVVEELLQKHAPPNSQIVLTAQHIRWNFPNTLTGLIDKLRVWRDHLHEVLTSPDQLHQDIQTLAPFLTLSDMSNVELPGQDNDLLNLTQTKAHAHLLNKMIHENYDWKLSEVPAAYGGPYTEKDSDLVSVGPMLFNANGKLVSQNLLKNIDYSPTMVATLLHPQSIFASTNLQTPSTVLTVPPLYNKVFPFLPQLDHASQPAPHATWHGRTCLVRILPTLTNIYSRGFSKKRISVLTNSHMNSVVYFELHTQPWYAMMSALQHTQAATMVNHAVEITTNVQKKVKFHVNNLSLISQKHYMTRSQPTFFSLADANEEWCAFVQHRQAAALRDSVIKHGLVKLRSKAVGAAGYSRMAVLTNPVNLYCQEPGASHTNPQANHHKWATDSSLLLFRAIMSAAVGIRAPASGEAANPGTESSANNSHISSESENDGRLQWFKQLVTHPYLPDTILQRFVYRAVGANAVLGSSLSQTFTVHDGVMRNNFTYIVNSQAVHQPTPSASAFSVLPILPSPALLQKLRVTSSALGVHMHQTVGNYEAMYQVKNQFMVSTGVLTHATYTTKLPQRHPHVIMIDLATGTSFHSETLPCINEDSVANNPDHEHVCIRLTRNMLKLLPAFSVNGGLNSSVVGMNTALLEHHDTLRHVMLITARDDLAAHAVQRALMAPLPLGHIAIQTVNQASGRLLTLATQILLRANPGMTKEQAEQHVHAKSKDTAVNSQCILAAKGCFRNAKEGSGWSSAEDPYERRLLLDVFLNDKVNYAADSIMRRAVTIAVANANTLPSALPVDKPRLVVHMQAKADVLITMAAANMRLLPQMPPAWEPAL